MLEYPTDDVYKVFYQVGRTLIRVMGGASGIIFGTLFYAGSKNMNPKSEISPSEFAEIFSKALTEIQAKGQAQPGDKTIVDALDPMVRALHEDAAEGVDFIALLQDANLAVKQGTDASKNYIAKFGKAKSLGERAIGNPDPGCVSLDIITQAMVDWAIQESAN